MMRDASFGYMVDRTLYRPRELIQLAFGDVPTHGTGSWLPLCDPGDLIEILWRAGLLTAQPAEGGRFLGSHQVQHLNLAAVQRFRVHDMFHASLGIVAKDA